MEDAIKHLEIGTVVSVTLTDPGLVINGPDGMSCLHACIQMVQRVRSGLEVYSFKKIDGILNRKEGLYAWEYPIFTHLAQQGYKIESYQLFDILEFIKSPENYLIDYYGDEVGKDQIENSDITQVTTDAKAFTNQTLISTIKKAPTIGDLRRSIDEGKYVLASINQRILQADEGVVSHLIFIYGYSERGIRFHNPGPPATMASEITWELFEKAWNKPLPENREMFTFQIPV